VRAALHLVLLLAWLAPALLAQEGSVTLEVRVTSSEHGVAWIDRGSADGLLVGDVVLLLPRAGGTFQGTLSEVGERSAKVALQDPAFEPPSGTRGQVRVPRERLGATPAPRLRPTPRRPEAESPPVAWSRPDDDWAPGQPLLAKVRPPRPEERPRSIYGRAYTIFDYADSSEDERTDLFLRAGTNVTFENAFGHGERVLADLEWNVRDVDVPDQDDENGTELRLDRLSYAVGGTRYEPQHWEFGRFLLSGMPEFGVVDGVEWGVRTDSGQRFGASVGFMPEPDEEFQSGEDLQFSGYYRWVADESEQFALAGGYQKTFHNGAADRDLVVATLQRLPRVGWTSIATLWLDLYTSGDDAKGSGIGLTQAYLSSGRRWESGHTFDVVYTHLEFPELERHEFLPVTDDQLADDHAERLALSLGLQLTDDTRLSTGVGAWTDEDESGGDGELTVGIEDFLAERNFMDLSVFGTRGRFETALGARFGLGRALEQGRLGLYYEFSANRLDGFTSANDDLPQHRLRLASDWSGWAGWDVSARLEGVLYDDEHAILVGLYLQRSF